MIPALLLCVFSTPSGVDPEPKVSLPVVSEEQGWKEPGLRLALGYSFGSFESTTGVAGGLLHSADIRLGIRLDDAWSLFGAARYGGFSRGADSGFHFSGTLEPTLHLSEGLSLSLGLGLEGLIVSRLGAENLPIESELEASYTLPDGAPALSECDGNGFVALIRADYAAVVTESFATGPSIQVESDWTKCTKSLDRRDPDTAEEIELHQYWQHVGVSLGWLVWWR